MSLNALLDAFFPPVCPVCLKRVTVAAGLCPDCFARLSFVRNNTPDRAAAVVYDETSKPLLMMLKYGDRPDLAALMARLMYNAGGDVLSDADLLTGVPLHWKRLLFRKYNQAAVLATELSRLSGISVCPDVLKRVKSTPKQGTREERFENVKGAFVSNPSFPLQGKTVVLIDDVVTTGATAQACRAVLMKSGAKEVRLLTFAEARSENYTRP